VVPIDGFRTYHGRGCGKLSQVTTNRRTDAAGAVFYRGARGRFAISLVHGQVVLLSMQGHIDDDLSDKVVAECEAMWRQGGRFGFFDTGMLAGYASRLRTGMTELVKRTNLEVHVLVRSKLVAMGVSIANMALGGTVHSYNDTRAFDAQIEKRHGPGARRELERLRSAIESDSDT
jgi:hypothetical protein